jgi:hypothetical protein
LTLVLNVLYKKPEIQLNNQVRFSRRFIRDGTRVFGLGLLVVKSIGATAARRLYVGEQYMSYEITISNHYVEAIIAFGGIINSNQNNVKIPRKLGTGSINIQGIGTVSFLDVGKKDIGGHSKKTWGVLISYQGEELVFRYDGDGQLNVTINDLGQVEIKGNGDFSRISLPSFILK